MEIITEIQNQLMLIVPIGLAILSCVLVYIYSIGPTQQPKFKLTSGDDRKAPPKKKKLKEKKPAANGHVATGISKTEKSPAKEAKKALEPVKKEKKSDTASKDVKKTEGPKKPIEGQEIKKRANKKVSAEKPADFDDGNWETVPSKADKKKKGDQPPAKKEKKVKPQLEIQVKVEESLKEEEAPPVVIEKIAPDVEAEPEVHAEPELVVEEVATPVEEVVPIVEEVAPIVEEVAPIVEQKKDKKKKKPKASKAEKVGDEVGAIPAAKEAVVPQPQKIEAPASQQVKPAPAGAVSDELGDTWTEAKPVKKSKKKARRDN